jgi:hypothetical protein
MDYDYKQANKNGDTFFGPQPEGPERGETVDIIKAGLSSNGWTIVAEETTRQPFKLVLKANTNQLTVNIYCWRISNGGRKRESEQRIQIGNADKAAFFIDNSSEDQKGLLLGVYRSTSPGTEPIFVAWETEKNKNHGSSKSCFVSIEAIALAMRDGFIQTRDTDNNLICAFRKEFLNFYIVNMQNLHTTSFCESGSRAFSNSSLTINERPEAYSTTSTSDLKGENRIVYGAPGTGKSHLLNERYSGDCIRVTFHPEYSYYDFVGSLRPKKINDSITYEYTPGPFSKILKQAYLESDRMHNLIIEEINRANTAAVFGDLFQLLDRNDDGSSEYSIVNEDLLTYLNSNSELNLNNISIPSNLNIVATMNSADQGVFLMDSAFKRRWQFEYIKIDFNDVEHADLQVPYCSGLISWRNLVECINLRLAHLEINEDKHIGPYFIKGNDVCDKDKIASKLLIYLWDDVVRHNRHDLFNTEKFRTFSDISEAFKIGEQIFQTDIVTLDKIVMSEKNE